MRKILLTTGLAFFGLTGAAHAFPAEAVTTRPDLVKMEEIAHDFWAERDVHTPDDCTPSITLADSLLAEDGADAIGRGGYPGTQYQCQIWLQRPYVRQKLDDVTPQDRWVGQQTVCALMVHEYGHTGGLQHTDNGGIMDPVITGGVIPYPCEQAFPAPVPAAVKKARESRFKVKIRKGHKGHGYERGVL